MKTIKIKNWDDVPKNYTGIVKWSDGSKGWYKNGNLHREDEPGYIDNNGYKMWFLDGKYVWDSESKLDLENQIILSKTKHPEYPTVQVWKIFDSEEIYEQTVIPGMEEHIAE